MINVNFFINKRGLLLGFSADGHAEFAEAGCDIVCAAVSSAMFMVANTISEILSVQAKIDVKDVGEMSLEINEGEALSCRDLMLGLKLHLLNLEEQYPQNVNVNYVEV